MKPVYYTPDEVGQQDLFSLVDNVKEDRTPEDLLFQVMLDLGVLLYSPIEVKEIAGKKKVPLKNKRLRAKRCSTWQRAFCWPALTMM